MKKHTYILFSIILLGILSSCTKEGLLTYDIKDNIYFIKFPDSLDVSFAYSNASVQDSLVKMPVYVTGVPADRDRIFTLSVDPSSTAVENTDYSFPETFTIHKGQVSDTIYIKLERTDDLQTTMKTLILNLTSNEEFDTNLGSEDSQFTVLYKITVSDMLTAGRYWGSLSYYYGDFSVKKIQLMHQVTGMPLDFIVNPTSYNDYNSLIPYYGLIMNRYLLDQQDLNNTIYEEDGVTEMRMGVFF
ncbi:DUF4843 domain-containing protein [Flavivirga sp. 57AJ16]|uniref:DUF4843 domain-containing protein n=1 Tax=Flavivirga sp. 57AJ16 TaxID=3025307 RepID=UPI0023652E27|nr:DUF4843 domain-containing protein [Flavivirga sp. 57AJ16]MDD7885092.1 DUF4843 domain-containing protein [Flavivirga sp. 57AJ16]